METTSSYKPIGGVESATLYPADAVEMALFSSNGCEVALQGEAIAVELLDDASYYQEVAENHQGAKRVSHTLHLVADRIKGQRWLEEEFLERCAVEGVIAAIKLCDGRHLLAGYSATFASEQPLRLESATSTSGTSPHDIPTVTLRLVSHDTAFSPVIL